MADQDKKFVRLYFGIKPIMEVIMAGDGKPRARFPTKSVLEQNDFASAVGMTKYEQKLLKLPPTYSELFVLVEKLQRMIDSLDGYKIASINYLYDESQWSVVSCQETFHAMCDLSCSRFIEIYVQSSRSLNRQPVIAVSNPGLTARARALVSMLCEPPTPRINSEAKIGSKHLRSPSPVSRKAACVAGVDNTQATSELPDPMIESAYANTPESSAIDVEATQHPLYNYLPGHQDFLKRCPIIAGSPTDKGNVSYLGNLESTIRGKMIGAGVEKKENCAIALKYCNEIAIIAYGNLHITNTSNKRFLLACNICLNTWVCADRDSGEFKRKLNLQ